ncbi:uncharacterized protein LOC107858284 [Capsicum annuum]|uniref:uncharacterized protein LOC107858284 n=1 Tax=Capsicum annuum TaxID=4072 RepID=UPI001FB0A6A8|nr:uncharacterized protein LOC107858284 [Capsicum annuum]
MVPSILFSELIGENSVAEKLSPNVAVAGASTVLYRICVLVTVAGADPSPAGSSKRRDLLHHHQAENLKKLLEFGEAHTGRGLRQELRLQRSGDTRWGSHFKTLNNFLVIFSYIIHVLGVIEIEGSTLSDRNQAEYLLKKDFTNKKKDQDIVNAVEFLNISKKRLQDIRENGWESLLDVSQLTGRAGSTRNRPITFNRVVGRSGSKPGLTGRFDSEPNNEPYFPEKSKHKCLDVCYSHHLHVEIFCVVIDVQLQELNDCFDVVSSDLLLGMDSLNSVNNFSNFGKGRIMTLAKCYPNEFDDEKLRDLSYQLDTFIIHMRGGNFKFSNLQEIRNLTKALVETNLVESYSLVYLLVKLTLILPLLR